MVGPGGWFGRGKAHAGLQDWQAAADDFTRSLEIQVDPIPLLNRYEQTVVRAAVVAIAAWVLCLLNRQIS